MREKFVAGNWKMHGSLVENKVLLDAVVAGLGSVTGVKTAVCVPYPYLFQVQHSLQGTSIGWGAQNLSEHAKGAYTGEVSASMLKDFGCQYVIIGHSERRSLYGETDAVVAHKYKWAHAAGLVPILCVGESLAERENGVTEQVVARQLDAVVHAVGAAGMKGAVIAYEPVWAIGTGKTATPEQAQAVHAFIRGRLREVDAELAEKTVIQYGGSVKAANAAELFGMPDIDGGLIGGASLHAEDFVAICRAAQAS